MTMSDARNLLNTMGVTYKYTADNIFVFPKDKLAINYSPNKLARSRVFFPGYKNVSVDNDEDFQKIVLTQGLKDAEFGPNREPDTHAKSRERREEESFTDRPGERESLSDWSIF